MGDSSPSSSSRFWVLTITGTAAAAGLGYLAYTYLQKGESKKEDEQDFHSTVPSETALARLRIARSIQMQTLVGGIPKRTAPVAKSAQPSVRQTPKQGAAKANPAGGNRKICARCSQPTPPGLPLRCSGCKQVYYCSQDCQRKAWPDHKGSCKAISTSAKQAAPAPLAPAPAPPPASASLPTLARGVEPTPGQQEPKTFQDALAMYLEQNAASKSDKMEATFETAVMQFVKGNFPSAIAQLQAVQAMAKERKDVSVEGDVYKWLGHAHNKMGDAQRAEEMFTAGIEFASKTNAPRLEVECLGGLGCMLKAQDQAGKAVELTTRALKLCEKLQDADLTASTLCNLGTTLMQSSEPGDSDKAMGHLRLAVKIREQTVERLHAAGERQGLATAVMEHAHATISLANALYIRKEFDEAKAAYEQSLEVFELVEDVDKISKVLINLSNMCEMQIKTVVARRQAAEYRSRLAAFMEGQGRNAAADTCPVCSTPQSIKEATKSDDKELVVLSCAHSLHNKCWETWVAGRSQAGKDVCCPTCSEVVPVFVVN